MYLEKEGYIIEEVVDGYEVIEKVLYIDYDLIVLDLMMFGIDGIEVCK